MKYKGSCLPNWKRSDSSTRVNWNHSRDENNSIDVNSSRDVNNSRDNRIVGNTIAEKTATAVGTAATAET
jgi:hypothetical protein